MEHPFLIDLSVKFGIDLELTNKLTGILEAHGLMDADSEAYQKAATYVCEMQLLDDSSEAIAMELKRKGLITE